MAHKKHIRDILVVPILFAQSIGFLAWVLGMASNPFLSHPWDKQYYAAVVSVILSIALMPKAKSIHLWRLYGLIYVVSLAVLFRIEILEMGEHAKMWGIVVTSLTITGMSILFMKPQDYLVSATLAWVIMWKPNTVTMPHEHLNFYYILVITSTLLGVNLSATFIRYMRNTYYLNERYRKLSETDPLTQAPNRRALIENMETSLKNHHRSNMWFAMLDIDNFKKINDQYGHEGGDKVLIHFSELISTTQNLLYFGRLGGEEFGLVIAEPSLESAANTLNNLLQRAMSDTSCYAPYQFSGGLANLQSVDSVQALLVTADKNLYHAKDNGKACIVFNSVIVSSLIPDPKQTHLKDD